MVIGYVCLLFRYIDIVRNKKMNVDIYGMEFGGKNTLDLCFARPEEILEWQRPCCATGNRRNHRCGDNSILRAHVTREVGSPTGCSGGLGLGVGLAICWFSCVCMYIALLISSLGMSGAAPSTWLMRALNLRGSCSWLSEHKGSWMVGYLCFCSRCAVTRHPEQ